MSVSSWLQDHPVLLARAYRLTDRALRAIHPALRRLGRKRTEPVFVLGEQLSKGWLFDCRMCGMCSLNQTGMTCPMTCPKQMRNGPCGGVRPDGKCEVLPDQDCVWVQAWERSDRMPLLGPGIVRIQPPVQWQLEGSSSWLNVLDGSSQTAPPGWSEGV